MSRPNCQSMSKPPKTRPRSGASAQSFRWSKELNVSTPVKFRSVDERSGRRRGETGHGQHHVGREAAGGRSQQTNTARFQSSGTFVSVSAPSAAPTTDNHSVLSGLRSGPSASAPHWGQVRTSRDG